MDGSQTSGSLTVLDSYTANSGTFVSSYESVNGYNQLVLENIQSDGDTVTLSGNVAVRGNVPFTWIRGQLVSLPSFLLAEEHAVLIVSSTPRETLIPPTRKAPLSTRPALRPCSAVAIIS